MKPLSLKLKGFKGILAGMGVHEVKMDFTRLPPGIIIFYAPNGSGKTTIMNNMQPYRIMPDHVKGIYSADAFSYYDHCYGNDACKDLLWELDGSVYRSLINIDTVKRRQECYLWQQDEAGWTPINRDGKTESYDRAVDALLGSPELFFTSLFRGQEARSLSRYTKGTMKDLFVELLGIEGERTLGDKAGQVHDALVSDLQALTRERRTACELVGEEESQKESHRATTEGLNRIRAEIEALENRVRHVQGEITDCVASLAVYKRTEEERTRLVAEVKDRKSRKVDLEQQMSTGEAEYGRKIAVATVKLQNAKQLAEEAPLLEKKALEKATLESSLHTLKTVETKLSGELDALAEKGTEFAETETEIKEKEKALQKIRLQKGFCIREARKELDDALAKEKKLAGLPCADNERLASRCRLVADAVVARNSIPVFKRNLADLETNDNGETAVIAEIEKLTMAFAGRAAYQDKVNAATRRRTAVQSEITRIETSLQSINEKLAVLPRVRLAQESVPELEEEVKWLACEKAALLEKIKAQVEAAQKQVSIIEGRIEAMVIDDVLPRKHRELQESLNTLQGEITGKRREEGDSRETLGAVEEKLRSIAAAKVKIADLEKQSAYLNGEISEWAVLKKAFGMDGIIPLEINDAGPSVAAIANELLLAFGSRYSVRIDTQLATADAKSLKEGFDITVLDASTNEERPLRRLSGGQKTWVEDAVTKALCIFNSRKHGRSFSTIFTDEKDGALDTIKKREYFDMKRNVLRLGGYEKEFCITHTPELLARADAIITIKDGRIDFSSTFDRCLYQEMFQSGAA
jgi:exonuclease SbcC